ncbi:hypothetical protein ACQ4PT_064991 [Festuca glaucescens]
MAGGGRTRPPSDQELIFQKRPSLCTSGIICRVLSNHISLHVNDKSDFSEIHQYDVSIIPVTSRCVNHAVMRQLVNKHTDVGFRPDCSAYDGSKILYTLGELNFGSSAFKITLQGKEEDSPDGPRALQRHFDVTIKRAARVSMKSLYELHDLMPDHVPPAILQALHIVLRELPTEEWDISDTPLTGTDLLKIVKALEGVKVHVLCNMHKGYCVSGVTSQSAEELIFPVDSHGTREPGETVVQYFQKRYGVSIQYKSLNCLQVGTPQRPEFLPLEVCKIAKGQRYSKELKFNDSGMTRAFLPHYDIWNMMGKGFNLSPVLSVETAKPEHAQLALTSLHSNVMAKLGPGRNLDLLVLILPDKNGSLYGDLKRICEADIGLVSQCCLSKHVLRKNKQYLANVALKINVKAKVENPKLAKVTVDGDAMTIPEIIEQLKKIVPSEKFNWEVFHFRDNVFRVKLPSKQDVQRLKNFGLPTDIRSDYLSLWGVGTLFGKTLDVDMAYTRNNKVLRTKIGCLDRNLIPADSDVFIRRGFFKLCFEVETAQGSQEVNMVEANNGNDGNDDAHHGEENNGGGNAMDMDPKGTDEGATSNNNGQDGSYENNGVDGMQVQSQHIDAIQIGTMNVQLTPTDCTLSKSTSGLPPVGVMAVRSVADRAELHEPAAAARSLADTQLRMPAHARLSVPAPLSGSQQAEQLTCSNMQAGGPVGCRRV